MHTIRLMASVFLAAATQAAAQSADTARKPVDRSISDAGGVTARAPGDQDPLTPHCWLGCRGSLQHTMPAEWGMNSRSRMDTLASLLRRKPHPVVPEGVRQTLAASRGSVSPAATLAPAVSDSGGGAPARPAATEADGERYLIEEWRRSEVDIADSIHHVVLLRLAGEYDSAQRSTVSTGDRARILQDVDGINTINQLMWLQRRAEVNRQADSALRALSVRAASSP